MKPLFKWLLLCLLIGAAAGTASAFFLYSLDVATALQTSYHWLLWLLPLGGVSVQWLYIKYGQNTVRGNNLVLEQIHDGDGSVPLRMAPLVLIGTLITHLFGGSAGREGTAVQMGGSLTSGLTRLFKLNSDERRMALLCGLAAGFGSVFGTPLAGTAFGIEASARGAMKFRALIPCLAASYTGHYVTILWGAKHTHFHMGTVPAFSFNVIGKVILAAIAFGLAAKLFVLSVAAIKKLLARWMSNPLHRSFIGGIAIIAFVYTLGTRQYLGLGLPLMEQAFHEAVSPVVPLLKTMFTAMTLGSGFVGGEVTPLFVIGSTLGSALSPALALPASFLAALGLAAVFGAASKTPFACTILGLELFGVQGAFFILLACLVSTFVSGRSTIYESHIRFYVPKRLR
ncbi:chloride channel protein [Paenibacillus sp. GCM10027627]|uniref:chloride channel protein n=1 Tax=unclassified Paenibacillus TaxID=185978 RepID=UPI00362CDBBE